MSTVVGASFAFPYQDFQARAVQAAGDVFGKGGGADPAAVTFLQQMHEDAIAEDIEELSVDDMVFLAAGFWTWAQERRPDETKVRLVAGRRADGGALRRDILEIVTSDKPFLVDSVMGEINELGVDVLAMFHPVVTVSRDPRGHRDDKGAPQKESLIQVHLEPLDDTTRERVIDGVRATLNDVAAAVGDFDAMRARMDAVIEELLRAKTGASAEEFDECLSFLRWLRDDRFAFLGARQYEFPRDASGRTLNEEPDIIENTGLGVLRDAARHVLRRGSEPAILTPAIQDFLREPSPIIVAKANLRSRVHRRVYADYVGVKRFSPTGEVVGETRFVGLFTADAYHTPPAEVPLIRRKLRRVLERANKSPGSHNHKQLKNILETYPRDELFQSDENELLEISLGILHLNDRPRAKLFIRRDRFDRFISAFVFVPRERYNSRIRVQIGQLLASAYDGRLSAFYPYFGEGPLARVHMIIGLNPFEHPEPDPRELERRIAEFSRTWEDDFVAISRRSAPSDLRPRMAAYESAFSAGYREAYAPEEALIDAESIEAAEAKGGVGVRAYKRPGDGAHILRMKLYSIGAAQPLSDMLPTLENLGLHVRAETAYPVRRAVRTAEGEVELLNLVYIHDFEMASRTGFVDFDVVRAPFEAAFLATWRGLNENDGFNRMIVALALPWRDVAFLRTCARYRQQTGLDPSQPVQEEALAENPDVTRLLLEMARVRLDPSLKLDLDARGARHLAIEAEIATALEAVTSLEHDRVLRRLARLIAAIQRTNLYQKGADGAAPATIAIKIASQTLNELPLPKPYREIFVWSPRVEGVHIRFGPVARGGLRWSDRRDDFRTEVLSLVKAQVVKNAVIVPVGAKGGFFPKHLPKGGTREAIQEEGVAAYKAFVGSLLDLTDNIVDGVITPPKDVVVWDGEDPYLVVAADKGTATFSDIANGLALDRGFWLGDAFASGGSAGYDHKKMAITARGAWIAVQRHFREMGKDIQTEPFTVIGVGDMSGDVFGNGMLLSPKIRLLAAFDHRDIFIDPNPQDLAASLAERQRLFDTPRTTWKDYDPKLISKGGGVWSRSLKSIPVSAEVKALTGLTADAASPAELMKALLAAECELLWFGGIGTYIRAEHEQDWQVGDRANDAIRLTPPQVRAKVIGEGANLGVTQAGRIGLARRGVRLNADFIDNAGGVDSSDNEVNIKILLNPIMASGSLPLPKRNALLESMTDDVARNVLKHNYDQTLAISMAEAAAAEDLDAHERLIVRLEQRGQLNREVEGLPSAEAFRELKAQGLGLTRPELSILVSYSKIGLFNRILETPAPDDTHFADLLQDYFPPALGVYRASMASHRLRRDIIATVLANDIVNLGGPTFVHRARESTGGDTAAVVRGFEASRVIFGLQALIQRIHALDNQVSAAVQLDLYREIVMLLRRQTYWLMRRTRGEAEGERSVSDLIAAYKPGVDALRPVAVEVVSPFEKQRVETRVEDLIGAGAPRDLAQDVAALRPLTSTSDVVDLAARRGWPLKPAALLYHAFGDRLRFDRLRAVGGELKSNVHWDRLAVRRLIEDFYAEQLRVTELAMAKVEKAATGSLVSALAGADAAWAQAGVKAFVDRHSDDVEQIDETWNEITMSGPWTLSKLAILSTSVRELATTRS